MSPVTEELKKVPFHQVSTVHFRGMIPASVRALRNRRQHRFSYQDPQQQRPQQEPTHPNTQNQAIFLGVQYGPRIQ